MPATRLLPGPLGVLAVGVCVGIVSWVRAGPDEPKPALPKEPAAKPADKSAAEARPANDERFHKRLLEIAGEYAKWRRVDGSARWAPELCAAPARLPPPAPQVSNSDDEAAHGRKLYFLFANDVNEYLGRPIHRKDPPPPLAVVKESWKPQELPDGERLPNRWAFSEKNPYPYVTHGGKTYKAAEKGDLFVMFKTDPAAEGTDGGWVYGTVSADGKTVTSAGRVESCMGCHAKAPKDRLFGLPKANGE